MIGSNAIQNKKYRKDIFGNKHESVYYFNTYRTFNFVPNFV